MTNYNERLDEILSYKHEVEGCQALHSGSKCLHCNEDPCPHCKRWGGRQRTEVRSMVDKKTKQAITSLYKELVAEAKPSKKHVGDEVAENRSYTGERLFNATIDEYHSSLLKELEEL